MIAIDGFGVEELYYNGNYSPDNERINMLLKLRNYKKILVSEFIYDNQNIPDALNKNKNNNFICFPRTSLNYHYSQIPDSVPFSNFSDIIKLSDAKNFLYLIDYESFSSRDELINAIQSTEYDIILIDLFFNQEAFKKSEIEQLKKKPNGKKRIVISYINIGAAEKYRYYWKKNWFLHHPHWIKKKYEGYTDEYRVKFWNKEWQNIIYGNENSYIKKIINAGFDGAYLDNVETYHFLYYEE